MNLFRKNIGPMRIDNTSVIFPMYGTVLFEGLFIKNKNEDIDIEIYSVNNDGDRIDKGLEYDISKIEYPKESCQSANVYLTSFEICTKVQFVLTTIKTKNMTNETTITNDINDYNQILDKVKIRLTSPPSIDKTRCSTSIEYIVIDNSFQNTTYSLIESNHTDNRNTVCVEMKDIYVYSYHNHSVENTNVNDTILISIDSTEEAKQQKTIIGCDIPNKTYYYDLSSRCKQCKFVYSTAFLYSDSDQYIFQSHSSGLYYYNYLSDIIGKEKYSFIHSNTLYSKTLYPYVNLTYTTLN